MVIARHGGSMARLRLGLAALVMPLFTPARPAAAQILEDSVHLQEVTAAGRDIVHWTFDEGIGEQTIYLKNVSKDRPVTIISWRVFDCDNIKRRSCKEHREGPTLQPGQTLRLATVQRQDEQRAYSYRYDFTASYPEDEAASK
jgi:hypothetical protein